MKVPGEKTISDADAKDLCRSCQKAFDCMGQGVFGTEDCSEWEAIRPQTTESTDEQKTRAGRGRHRRANGGASTRRK